MKFAALGRTESLYHSIVALVEAGHEPSCIITAPAAPEYGVTEGDFSALAKDLNCPFTACTRLDPQELSGLASGATVAISVNWPTLIPESILDLFVVGIVNLHAGDLPRYRGNACPNWAILNGEKTVTLSSHLMEPRNLDCGRVISQRILEIDKNTYIADINEWMKNEAPPIFLETINRLDENPDFSLKVARETDLEASRCYPRTLEDGFIDWRKSVEAIHRLVRASSHPLPGAYTYRFEQEKLERIFILKAKIHSSTHGNDFMEPGQVLSHDRELGSTRVACGSGILELTLCKDQDGTIFSPGVDWKSSRMRLGVRPEDLLWFWMQRP